MSSDIPHELYPEILIRLPVKSLLRFKCVSKSWNSLITSPEFITMYINHNNANNNNNNALLRMYYTDSRVAKYTLHLENENLDKIMEIEFPENYFQEFFYIVGCVNGLVCLADSYQRTNTVLLWNPLIRKFLTLPTPSNELSCQELMETSMGFGFDIQGKDYKFVRIYKINGRLSMDLFKLSTSNWIDVDVPSSLPCLDWIATYFNGVLHWFANSDNLIVGLDLGLETFTKIMLPRELKRTSSNSVWDGILITVWRGFLALVEREDGYRYCLWVMKEYGVSESWTKQFVVEGFGRLNNVRRNGELMFYDRDFSYLDSYDSETQSTKHNILGLEEELNMLQMTPYIESLVLVNEGTSYLLDQ